MTEPKASAEPETRGGLADLYVKRRAGIIAGLILLLIVIGIATAPTAPRSPSASTSPAGYPPDIRAGRSMLERALLTARTYAQGNDNSYTDFDSIAGMTLQPDIVWQGAVPATYGRVSVDYAKGPTIILSTRAKSGTYLCRASGSDDEAAGFEDALGATLSSGCAGANP